jgi:hypothetical protein
MLNQPETRVFLKNKLRTPRLGKQPPPRVPPRAQHANRVGTAFDYALRAGLAARYEVQSRSTTAEAALLVLATEADMFAVDADSGEGYFLDEPGLDPTLNPSLDPERFGRIAARVQVALDVWRAVGTDEELTEEAARACYQLAGLDPYYRAHIDGDLEREPDDVELDELRALYRIVPWPEFNPEARLWLNPTFGEGSRLLGGADADVIRDDLLIEVKTVKKLRSKTFRQLIGYALLANAYGVNCDAQAPQSRTAITRIGVYLSRAGKLVTWPLEDVLPPEGGDDVLAYLVSAAASPELREDENDA